MNALCSQPEEGVGALLSRNWFLTSTNHETAALKIEGLKGYIAQVGIQESSIADAARVAGEIPAVQTARTAVAVFRAAADRAQALINAAAAAVTTSGVPSDPNPPSVSLASWREAWYINSDAAQAVLAEADDARLRSTDAVYAALAAAKQVQIKQAQAQGTPPPPPMPKGTPASRIDWSGTVTSIENALGLKKLAQLAPSVSFGLGAGTLVVLGIGLLLLARPGRGD
jgi:hypothetical protein